MPGANPDGEHQYLVQLLLYIIVTILFFFFWLFNE